MGPVRKLLDAKGRELWSVAPQDLVKAIIAEHRFLIRQLEQYIRQ